VRITGHTDRLGGEMHNQLLSDRRAHVVRDYLIAHGVASGKVSAMGLGPSRPVTTPEQCPGPRSSAQIACLQPDRRVDIDIYGL
jgi:outer membrane protein OmpA-like peptidoglycan-associated protein